MGTGRSSSCGPATRACGKRASRAARVVGPAADNCERSAQRTTELSTERAAHTSDASARRLCSPADNCETSRLSGVALGSASMAGIFISFSPSSHASSASHNRLSAHTRSGSSALRTDPPPVAMAMRTREPPDPTAMLVSGGRSSACARWLVSGVPGEARGRIAECACAALRAASSPPAPCAAGTCKMAAISPPFTRADWRAACPPARACQGGRAAALRRAIAPSDAATCSASRTQAPR